MTACLGQQRWLSAALCCLGKECAELWHDSVCGAAALAASQTGASQPCSQHSLSASMQLAAAIPRSGLDIRRKAPCSALQGQLPESHAWLLQDPLLLAAGVASTDFAPFLGDVKPCSPRTSSLSLARLACPTAKSWLICLQVRSGLVYACRQTSSCTTCVTLHGK